MSGRNRPRVEPPRITVGLIGAPDRLALAPDTMVVLVPEGAGHVREVRNGGEKALLVFEAGIHLEAEVVPLCEAKGRCLYRNEIGWHNLEI